MAAMNDWLSQVYGTNGGGAEEEVEKVAQAMMLQKLSQDEGIDLSGLSEEQLQALANQVVSQGGAAGEAAPAQAAAPAAEAEAEKIAQAKFAEADFLGRVMAHAFNQELGQIKQAEDAAPPFPPKKKEEEEKKEEEKTANGPLAQAIRALGGTVEGDQTSTQVEKLAEQRAIQLLRQAGYNI